MGFSRQEYWSGLPFPPSGDLPDPGIEPGSPALQADTLLSEPPEKPLRTPSYRMCIFKPHWLHRASENPCPRLLVSTHCPQPHCVYAGALFLGREPGPKSSLHLPKPNGDGQQEREAQVAQRLKHLPPVWQTRVRSLGQEDPLENEMAPHSSILAWRIPWTEKPSRLQSMGSQRVGHD